MLFFPLISQAASLKPAERYPDRLITSDYGIVTVDDLAYDATQRYPSPFRPTKHLLARYWQCVPCKDVKPETPTWRGEDGMGPAGVVITMCELEISVQGPRGTEVYGDRRAHPNSFCKQFLRNWKRLTKSEKIICLNGDDPIPEKDETGRPYLLWTWNKFKTRKGCYSYFGDCNTKGCAAGRCPE